MCNVLHLILTDIHAQSFIQVAEHVGYGHHDTWLIIDLLLGEIRPNRLFYPGNDRSLILLSEYLLFGKLWAQLGHDCIHEYHQLIFSFLLVLSNLLIWGFHVWTLFKRGLTGVLLYLKVSIFWVLIRGFFNQIVFVQDLQELSIIHLIQGVTLSED